MLFLVDPQKLDKNLCPTLCFKCDEKCYGVYYPCYGIDPE